MRKLSKSPPTVYLRMASGKVMSALTVGGGRKARTFSRRWGAQAADGTADSGTLEVNRLEIQLMVNANLQPRRMRTSMQA
jgi:hypothetical protein